MTTKMLKNFLRNILAAAAILLPAVCLAIPDAPSPQRTVNDFAGIFTPQQVAALEKALVAFDDSTSNQITVVTVTDLEGYAASEYATRIGLAWGVGSEKSDNGVVLLVKPKTPDSAGEVAISVGYGLEGAIPDVYAKRIIDNEIIPRFRENDYYGGVAAACSVLMQLASGEISEPRERSDESSALVPFFLLASIIGLIILIASLSRGGRNGKGGGGRRYYDDGDIASAIIIGNLLGGGRAGHSSWGGSGGFGGGFGGFGGGSFGGGGASGSW